MNKREFNRKTQTAPKNRHIKRKGLERPLLVLRQLNAYASGAALAAGSLFS